MIPRITEVECENVVSGLLDIIVKGGTLNHPQPWILGLCFLSVGEMMLNIGP